VLVGLIAAGLYWREHKAIIHFKATEKDPIVLADFDNKTGDPVFDDTLKQGLAIQLEQLAVSQCALRSEGRRNLEADESFWK
jgi:eukaryotic-like serine/threonine-protein kinase